MLPFAIHVAPLGGAKQVNVPMNWFAHFSCINHITGQSSHWKKKNAITSRKDVTWWFSRFVGVHHFLGNVSISLMLSNWIEANTWAATDSVFGDSSSTNCFAASSDSRSEFVCSPPCQLPALPTACTSVSERQNILSIKVGGWCFECFLTIPMFLDTLCIEHREKSWMLFLFVGVGGVRKKYSRSQNGPKSRTAWCLCHCILMFLVGLFQIYIYIYVFLLLIYFKCPMTSQGVCFLSGYSLFIFWHVPWFEANKNPCAIHKQKA